MPENIRNIIYRFSQELRRILGDKLTKIIVYGSYARGDFRENSDIDIMILVKMSDEEIRLVKNDIYDLAFEFEINTGIESVSYTHLDVYKRQVEDDCEIYL